MNCKIVLSKLPDYYDNDLYRDDRCAVETHLDECASCREAWHEMKSFSDTCAEFVVCPGRPYSFAALRARMATVRPLDEIQAFLPKMRARGATARFAVSLLLLFFAVALPGPIRSARDACAAVRRPFVDERDKWTEEYQEELDRQYRQQMALHHRPPNRSENSA